MDLRHRGELAESSGELHKGEIPPAKGEDAGGELHPCLRWIILSRYTGSRNEETRILTNEVFNETNGGETGTQVRNPNSFDT